jgi:hypothetical protein
MTGWTFMPAQNEALLRWSHVYTIQLRTCFLLGAVSSILVALRMLMASSDSVLAISMFRPVPVESAGYAMVADVEPALGREPDAVAKDGDAVVVGEVGE